MQPVMTRVETRLVDNVSTNVARQQETPDHNEDPLFSPGVYTFWRGRVALYAILKSLGIGSGDFVLVPGYTCFAVPAAMIFAGAQPLYVDIDPDTFNITLATIRSAWNEHANKKIKAILIQHTYGLPANLAPIIYWARDRGIATIEDCAHAWGSRYRDEGGGWRDVGTVADASFFSSQWTKPVSTGLGGWARVNNTALQSRMREFHEKQCVAPSVSQVAQLVVQLITRKLFSSSWAHWSARSIYQALYTRGLVVGTSTPEELAGKMPTGYATRMSKHQKRLLRKQLTNLALQDHRRALKNFYDAALNSAGLPVVGTPDHADPVYLRYPVRVLNKPKILQEAQRRRVELGDWYSDTIDTPEGVDPESFGYRRGTCPEGERAAAEVVNLPMHPGVTDEVAYKAVQFLKEVA